MNRKTFCNNFSKFLTNLYSEDGKYMTHSSVVDVLNFYILKVDTENKNEIDQSKLVEMFWKSDKSSFGGTEYSKYNIINLIKTNQKDIMKNVKYTINLESDELNQVESLTSGTVSSDFFVGVSNERYHKLYEKLKQITNLVSPYFKLTQIEYVVEDFELVSINTNSYYPSDKLLSIILDNFDLNTDEEINKDTLFLNVI
jgi:hypothetical protein